jgi:hypothetical protein
MSESYPKYKCKGRLRIGMGLPKKLATAAQARDENGIRGSPIKRKAKVLEALD